MKAIRPFALAAISFTLVCRLFGYLFMFVYYDFFFFVVVYDVVYGEW